MEKLIIKLFTNLALLDRFIKIIDSKTSHIKGIKKRLIPKRRKSVLRYETTAITKNKESKLEIILHNNLKPTNNILSFRQY